MDKCNLDQSAVFLDSCGHELLEFFGCSLSEAVFVHNDVAVLVAEQKVVGPGFDAGKLEEAVLAVGHPHHPVVLDGLVQLVDDLKLSGIAPLVGIAAGNVGNRPGPQPVEDR